MLAQGRWHEDVGIGDYVGTLVRGCWCMDIDVGTLALERLIGDVGVGLLAWGCQLWDVALGTLLQGFWHGRGEGKKIRQGK